MNPPKATRSKLLFRIAILFLALLLAYSFAQPTLRKWSLVRACAGADRVVVDLNTWPGQPRIEARLPTFPAFEAKGSDKVAALLNSIELRRSWLPLECTCFGEMLFRIYQGDRRLADVSLHHDKYLRQRKAWWLGDVGMTERSRLALLEWLRKNGCPTYDEAAAINTRLWKVWRSIHDPDDDTPPTSAPTTAPR